MILNNNCLNDFDLSGLRDSKVKAPQKWDLVGGWWEIHSWNCQEWKGLKNNRSGGHKDEYIEHFESYTFGRFKKVSESARSGFAYGIVNAIGMDINSTDCWCFTGFVKLFREKVMKNPKYKLVLTIKNLDRHPGCCSEREIVQSGKIGKTITIGPY